jgi:hypothetical protein
MVLIVRLVAIMNNNTRSTVLVLQYNRPISINISAQTQARYINTRRNVETPKPRQTLHYCGFVTFQLTIFNWHKRNFVQNYVVSFQISEPHGDDQAWPKHVTVW